MSESEAKKCPKCEGEMKLAATRADLGLFGRSWHGILPFYCRNCGYIELYKGMKKKERKIKF
jgi:C4-type Zn-finger protein